MHFKSIAAIVLSVTSFAGIPATTRAQTVDSSAPVKIEPSKSFDAVVTGLEKQLLPLAEAMPADKYNVAPSGEQFKAGGGVDYKGVRTFGQQLAHIIQANDFFFLGRVIKLAK